MPITATNLNYLRDVVSKRSGNVVSNNQDYLIESRLNPLAESIGLKNVEALVSELQRSPTSSLHDKVAEALTINETSFFRDIQPFESLKNEQIPRLIEQNQRSKKISIWSAASSSGQEAYSLAMLILEEFPQLSSWNVEILATDLSPEMVRRTSEGLYSQFEVNRGLPAKYLVKYFQRNGIQWEVSPALKKMVTCRKMNLTLPFMNIQNVDIVMLRNVLIYFDKPTKESILYRMHQVMSRNGCLFLGGGESMVNLDVPFTRQITVPTVCYQPL
ncbi:CheR family methyltransferase [Planctomicrobium sp. SH668]|uniref:CheR family methyltransferase n=1 Tax=Planctomicrobium sp. SH668 TaxID=3448126 RepID=UPI003F5B54AB